MPAAYRDSLQRERITKKTMAPVRASASDRTSELQRRIGNSAVARLARQRMLQRRVDIEGTLKTSHGVVLDQITKSAPTAGKLIAYCEESAITHLHFRAYQPAKDEFGETLCEVTGTDGRVYDLDAPANVDWDVVERDSPITITIRINNAHMFGQGEDVQTLLHELDVHAVAYLQFIEATRNAPSKRSIPGIWLAAIAGSSSGARQHRRLGAGRQRGLSKDVAAVGKAIGLGSQLETIKQNDIAEH
jgi:hypothetical protein